MAPKPKPKPVRASKKKPLKIAKTKSKKPSLDLKGFQRFCRTALGRWLEIMPVALQFDVPEGLDLQAELTAVDEARMIQINHKFRKKKAPTDVLSFPAPDIYQAQGYIGDLVICVPIVFLQALSVGHTWQQEVHVLIVHGLLHLIGFDHEVSPEASDLMARYEGIMLAAGMQAGLVQASGLIERTLKDADRLRS